MGAHKSLRAATPTDEDPNRVKRRERLLLLKRCEAAQRGAAVDGAPESGREEGASSDDAAIDPNAGVRHAEEEQRRARHLESVSAWCFVPVDAPEKGGLRDDSGIEP